MGKRSRFQYRKRHLVDFLTYCSQFAIISICHVQYSKRFLASASIIFSNIKHLQWLTTVFLSKLYPPPRVLVIVVIRYCTHVLRGSLNFFCLKFCKEIARIEEISEAIFLLMRTTHWLIMYFLVLNSISIALSISTA